MMLKDGFKFNVFVYNSLMNVSVGDLDEVQCYYQYMQVIILSCVVYFEIILDFFF